MKRFNLHSTGLLPRCGLLFIFLFGPVLGKPNSYPLIFSDFGTKPFSESQSISSDKQISNLSAEIFYSESSENSESYVKTEQPDNITTDISDSLALVNLYNTTNGVSWLNNTNWLLGPVSTWYGITVESNRVVEINLSGNNLSSLLPDLSALSSLKRLDLSSNNLSPSVIPASLNNLNSLEHLDLSNNRFNGTIPGLTGLTNLKSLSLANNQFPNQPLPGFIYSLTNLQILNLERCNFLGNLPSGISSLVNLQELDLSFNPLSGAGLSEIGSLNNLVKLEINSTSFSGQFPQSIAALSNLALLDLNNCFFTEMPPVTSWTSNQLTVDISNNNFDFGDLEPLAGVTNPSFINTGQKQFSLFQTGISNPVKLMEGDPIQLTPVLNGTQNNYQWYLNGSPIPGATGINYFNSNGQAGLAGQYQLQITNNLVPGITLLSTTLNIQFEVFTESIFAIDKQSIIHQDIAANSTGGYWADIDQDGDEDLFVGQNLTDVPNFLYENMGNGTFQKITTGDIVNRIDGTRYVSWGDYDNDGYPDLFVGEYSNLNGSPSNDNISSLYRNNSDKTFSRIEIPFKSDGGLWADYDNDGDLDLFINGTNATPATNKLYKNNGDGTFQLIDNWIPVTGTWYAGWVDIDNDGDLDYNITPFTAINQIKIFRNNGGTFTEENLPVPTGTFSHRGSSWADIDGDGDMDLFALNSQTSTAVTFADSQFYINDGTGTFTMVPASSRMGTKARGARGSTFGDVDNDGDLDLFVIHRPLATSADALTQLFINDGTGNFTLSTAQSYGYSEPFSGLSMADFNNDGSLDLFVGSYEPGRPNYLFRNLQTANGNNWIKFKLIGVQSNKTAIGARVDVYAAGKRASRQVLPSTGLQGQNSYIIHSGLGTATQADSVVIHWPSGNVQVLSGITANQMHTVIESINPPTLGEPQNNSTTLVFNPVYSTQMTLSFNPGDGENHLVIIKPLTAVDFIPQDGIAYSSQQNLVNSQRIVSVSQDSVIQITGLQPGTLYHVAIIEYNGAGSRTNYKVPGAVGSRATLVLPNVSVTSPANNATGVNLSVNVTSRSLTGATTYTIQLSPFADFSSGIIERSGSRTQNFSGLSYNTLYYTRVRTNLSPDYGQVTSFSTIKAETLSYVTSPGNNAVNVNNTSLNISSNTVSGASTYTIELSESPDFSTIAFTNTGASRTLAFSGLKYNTVYYNRVKTDLSATYGQVRSFTTRTAESIAYVTSPGNNAMGVNTVLNISSSSVPGASLYTIQLSETPDFATVAFEVSGGTRTLAFSGLKYNTTYYNRVLTNLTTNFGQVRSFSTRTAESISYVTSPANNAVNVNNTSLSITANSVPGASTYTIQLSETPDFGTIAFESTGNSRTLPFSNLKYNTIYYNRVFTNLSALPGQVRNFTTRTAESLAYVTSPANGATGRATSLNITSNTVPGATSYTIQLSESVDFSTIAFEVTGSSRTLAFSGLITGTTYYNRVLTNLTSVYGQVRSFTTQGVRPSGSARISADNKSVAVEQGSALKEFEVTIYPNPFREKLSFYVESVDEQAEVTLIDMTGRTMYKSTEKTNQQIQIEKEFTPGPYLLRIKTKHFQESVRVIRME